MLTKKTDHLQFCAVGLQAPEMGPQTSGFGTGSAANAACFERGRKQARRLRRQNRLSRMGGSLKVGGWAVKSW